MFNQDLSYVAVFVARNKIQIMTVSNNRFSD